MGWGPRAVVVAAPANYTGLVMVHNIIIMKL